MTSAYEWIITTRSFYRTRIELLSAAFPRLHSLPNKISELFSRTKFDDWKKKDQLWGYNNIPAKAEILIMIESMIIWLFSVPNLTQPPLPDHQPSNFFNEKLQKLFRTDLIRREILHNRKLTSIRIVFHLNKTFFTHIGIRINCFVWPKNETVDFIIKNECRHRKNRVNKGVRVYLDPKLPPWN